ncbi:MAG: DUF4294 domain-containing protein [Bacteroidia bacterium]
MKNAFLLFICLFLAGVASAQEQSALFVGDIKDYPTQMVTYTIDENGDSVPTIHHYTCVIAADRVFKNKREQQKYDKLKRDVKAAHPYAVLARAKLSEMDARLALIKGEKERKEFAEKSEKELVKQFENDMKNLTAAQGRILIKLVSRETGSTTYQLIKEYRGGLTAVMWQGLARVFGNNLKSEYDADGDDQKIEEIVELIELGVL